MTTSGNVSAHSTGDAVDIAQVNGIPILGHQGPGTITEAVIKDLLQLQGTMQPDQMISLMELGEPTFALPDHYDHVHVGYTRFSDRQGRPAVRRAAQARPVAAPDQAPRRDRQSRGPGEALQVLPARREAR